MDSNRLRSSMVFVPLRVARTSTTCSLVASGVIDDMARRSSSSRNSEEPFSIFVKATLENPSFSSQVKSECTSKGPDFGSQIRDAKELRQECSEDGYFRRTHALSKIQGDEGTAKDGGGARKSKITGIPNWMMQTRLGLAHSSKVHPYCHRG